MHEPNQKSSFYKLFRVRTSDGRVRTVFIAQALQDSAMGVMGGRAQLGEWVREAALRWQPAGGAHLSAFVVAQLQAAMRGGALRVAAETVPKAVPAGEKPKPRRATPTSEFERAFHELLGRLAHAHASLDFNVGLQLNWLGPYLAVTVQHLLDARRVAFAKRLSALRELVLELFEGAPESARTEFESWFERAAEMKALRNDYVHGRWGVPGKMVEGQPMLGFVPLHWDMTPDRPDSSTYMTIDDLERQVKQMEVLARDYFRLEKKYLMFAKVPKTPGDVGAR